MNMKIYSTGEVCKICNVSRKKLRYYEERGFLKGIMRGHENNYRYYTQEHLNELLLLRELSSLGFSLNEIIAVSENNSLEGLKKTVQKRMLNAREEMRQSMLRYEQSTEKYAQLLEAISHLTLESSGEKADNQEDDFAIIDYPSQYVVHLFYEGTFLDEEGSFVKGISKLYDIIEEYGITTLGSIISIYDKHFDSQNCKFNSGKSRVELCLPVANMSKPCPYYKKLDGFKCIKTTHIGKYDEKLDATYVKLLKWAKQNKYELTDTSYEDFLISPLLTRNDKYWVTNIMIPLAKEK